jgi:16S rRNA processing protein RimM
MPLLRVGVVARPHGIRGELAVTLDTPDGEALLQVKAVFLGEARHEVKTARRGRPGQMVLDLGFTDPAQVEVVRGAEVRVEEADLPPLEANEFWHRDLVGLRAVLADGTELGRVTEVVDTAEVAVLVVAGSAGEVYVPFADPHVIEVDVPGGLVKVAPPAE